MSINPMQRFQQWIATPVTSLKELHESRPRPTVRIGFVDPQVPGQQVLAVGELDTVGEAGHDSLYDVIHLTLREEWHGTTTLLIPIVSICIW
jgi:hypothetical protein